MNSLSLSKMEKRHSTDVLSIYLQGIETGNATFQTQAPSWEDWDKGHLEKMRLVATDADTVTGWAALSPVSGRCVYAGVAEVSVYVHSEYRGKKIGKLLLEELIKESESCGIWTLQAGIFPENEASIELHKKCGFRIVGRREKLGQLKGVWRDVMLLERRSSKVL